MADADAKPADADARDVVYIESPWGGTMAIERKQGSDLERFNSAYQGQMGRLSIAHGVSIDKHVSAVEFDVWQFVKALAYHILQPIVLPVIFACDGRTFFANQGWYRGPRSLVQYLISAVIVGQVVLWALAPRDSMADVSVSELLVPLIAFAVHKVMVATKYAYLPPSFIQDMHQRILSDEELSRYELAAGWANPKDEVIHAELLLACSRLGIDMDKVFFHVDSSLEALRDFCKDPELKVRASRLQPNALEISALRLLQQLQVVASRTTTRETQAYAKMAIYIALLHAMLPNIVRVASGKHFFGEGSAHVVLLLLLGQLTTLFYMTLLVLFVTVGENDYRRRYRVLQMLETIMDPAYHKTRQSSKRTLMRLLDKRGVDLPNVDLSVPENILAWFVTRQVAQSYGLMYKKRVNLYATYTFAIVLALMCIVAADVFRRSLALIPLVLAFYDVLVFAWLLFSMAKYASKANDQFAVDKLALVRVQLNIRQQIANAASGFAPLPAPRPRPPPVAAVATEPAKAAAAGPARAPSPSADGDASAARAPENEVRRLQHADLLLESVMGLLDTESRYTTLSLLGLRGDSFTRAVISILFASVTALLHFIRQG